MSKCLVCLSDERAILNALPLAYHIAQADEPPFMLVSAKHVGILQGCSYVHPVQWNSDENRIQHALAWANKTFKTVIVAQARAEDMHYKRQKDSWDRDAWQVAGYWPHWGTFPLVFDRVSKPIDPPTFVKHPAAGLHLGGLVNESEIAQLLNGRVKLYDLHQSNKVPETMEWLSVYHYCSVIVTTESKHLQLARAVTTPLIYLRSNRDRYECSVPPPNHVLTIGPDDINAQTIADAILGIVLNKWPANDAKLVHTCATYNMSGDNLRRHEMAKASWEVEYKNDKWIPAWLHEKDAPRNSNSIGDKKGVQFLKDMLNHAANNCRNDSDIIVLTNSDNPFVPGITERLIFAASRGPVYGHRMDFPRIDHILTRDEALNGRWYAGFDIMAFKRSWWLAHRNEYPDVLVSYSAWDFSLYILMRKYGGEDFGCAVTHESHESHWQRPEVRRSGPGERWNQKLNRPFLKANGVNPADFPMCA